MIQIRKKDFEALKEVADKRHLTVNLAASLLGRLPGDVRHRFNQLHKADYLNKARIPVESLGYPVPENPDKNLYWLGRKGHAIAVEYFNYPEPFTPHKALSQLAHELEISNFHVNLQSSLQRVNWTIGEWRQGRADDNFVSGKVRGENIRLLPDAFFSIVDPQDREYFFFLEVTKANPGKHKLLKENEVIAKAETYLAYAQEFREKHGPDFRVLFTLPTEAKLQNMLQMFNEREKDGLNNRRFYFALDGFNDPLAPIWRTPKDENTYGLLPTSQAE